MNLVQKQHHPIENSTQHMSANQSKSTVNFHVDINHDRIKEIFDELH